MQIMITSYGGHGCGSLCRCGHSEMHHTATVKDIALLTSKDTKFKCDLAGCPCDNFKDLHVLELTTAELIEVEYQANSVLKHMRETGRNTR